MKDNIETTVLFIWKVDNKLKSHITSELEKLSNVTLIFPDDTSLENLIKFALDANVIVGWRPQKELLLAASKLRLFINPGAGVQHLIDLFKEVNLSKNVLLVNCHGNSFFVAQHTLALLLALTNKLIQHHNWMIEGKWRRGDNHARTMTLKGKKVGLLGYGAINQKVHQLLSGFDLRFSIIRKNWNKQTEKLPTKAEKYVFSQFTTFLKGIDILIIALPLTPITEGLIKLKELKILGPDALVVNVSRGPVIDEESLFKALQDKRIAGAAIDVWYNYHPDPDGECRKYPFSFPFHTLENVVLSPHRAASPFNDLDRWGEVLENIRRFASGNKKLINVVDLEKGY
ncbi:MAG: NAD(P)-dependent oxidoreductase [Candidatus Bathyarchaeota archaeon]|jgi:phosphoglycerate dehydrogenase-like enzyme